MGLVLMSAGHWLSGTRVEEPCSIPKPNELPMHLLKYLLLAELHISFTEGNPRKHCSFSIFKKRLFNQICVLCIMLIKV